MSLKAWEKRILKARGASARVAEIEEELRLAVGLTALRERAGVSQRELARRMRVSQPRVVAIEQSRNVTVDVLEQYVGAIGGRLEMNVVQGKSKFPLVAAHVATSPINWRRSSKQKALGTKSAHTGVRKRNWRIA